MKGNHRKNKIWISILLIVALLTPMLPTFALADGEQQEGVVTEEPSADEIAAEQAAAEEAARLAAEEAARKAEEERIAAEEAARKAEEERIAAEEEAARKAAEEEAARKAEEERIAAEEAARKAEEERIAAEEAARKAAEEEAARIAAEEEAARKAAEEEAARIAAEEEAARKAAEEEAARKAAEEEAARKAAEEEAARKAAEEEAARKAAEEEAARKAAEEEAARKAAEQAQQAQQNALQIPAAVVATEIESVSNAAMIAGTGVISGYSMEKTVYSVLNMPETEEQAIALFASDLSATVSGISEPVTDLQVTWFCKSTYDPSGNSFEFSFRLNDTRYEEPNPGLQKPTVTLKLDDGIVISDEGIITNWPLAGENVELIVPTKVQNKTVKGISARVFANRDNLKSIVLPDGLETIGEGAFESCSNLEEITFPDTIKSVANDIFGVTTNTNDLKVTLAVYNKTTLVSLTKDESGSKTVFAPTRDDRKTISDSDTKVELPIAITDIEVNRTPKTGEKTKVGELTFQDDYTVATGHAITVNDDCEVILNANKKITNKGKIKNNGIIHICAEGSEVNTEENGTYQGTDPSVTAHVFPESGENMDKCVICGIIDLSKKGSASAAPVTYNGANQLPAVVVNYNGSVLDASTDYDVDISSDINAYVNAGKYLLTVTGKGSYTGTVELEYVINPKQLAENMLTISPASNVVYDGKNHELTATVTDDNKITANDYEMVGTGTYTNVGDYTVTVNGKNNYTGTVSKKFSITVLNLADCSVSLTPTSNDYTGQKQEPTVNVEYRGNKIGSSNYTISYSDSELKEAKQYTVTISGVSPNCTGTKELTYTINKKNIADFTPTVASQEYTGAALTPSVTIAGLTAGRDFTVSGGTFTNANAAGYDLTITGQGNYTGTVGAKFVVTPKPLTDAMVSVAATKVYDGNAMAVTVADGGRTLTLGTDYTVANGAGVDAGSYKLTVNGAGNNYTGSIVKEYTITKAKREVEIKLKSGHEPKKVYDATRNLTVNGKSLLSSSDFTISNVADGDKVTISSMFDTQNGKNVQPHFNSADVGTDKTITVHFAIKQTSTNYDYSLKSGSITIGGTITPKTLTVRPCDTKKSTSSNIVNQTKVYGTADPSLTAKISGLMATDQSKTSECIGGKLVRDAGENVGKYKVSVGTVKGKGNYAEKVEFEEGYFEITPKSVNATDVGMVAIGNQTYTGSAVEPEITLKYAKKVGTKTETETLVKGTDFDVKYTNNVEAGTATVTITGKGNYNGTRTATFRILKVAATTAAPSSPGTTPSPVRSGSSGGTSSGSNIAPSGVSSRVDGEGDDDEDDDTDAINVTHHRDELMNMDMDELNVLAEEYDIDPNQYATKEDLVKAILAAERADNAGELVLNGQPYGTILFGADDKPRPFLLYEEEIEDADGTETEAIEEDEEEDFDEDDEAEEDEDEDDTPKRLRVEAMNLQDEDGNDLFLDEEETREKYEELHLRLTPNQIDILKANHYVELIYELENAELCIKLDELKSEIDVSRFERPDPVKLVEPEFDADELDDDDYDELEDAEEGEDLELLEVENEDAAVMEVAEMEIAPNMKEVNRYDFCIEQLTDENMTDREKLSLAEKAAQYPYRLNAYAMHGAINENVVEPSEDLEDALENIEPAPTQDPEARRYPILGILKQEELRLIMEDEPYEDTQQLFVTDDASVTDAQAIHFSPVNYVEGEDSNYASFAPDHSGMYSVVDEPEEEFEPLPGVTYGPVPTPMPSATPEPEEAPEQPAASALGDLIVIDDEDEDEAPEAPDETPEPAPTPEPTEEPAPEVIEDPDPTYAYSRRSNEGNQYWLVDTVNKTIEYYSAIDDEYWVGDYTGSLMSGADVTTNNGKIVNIALKFQQTYKFALMNGDGPELLMEQDDVANVEAELSAHR